MQHTAKQPTTNYTLRIKVPKLVVLPAVLVIAVGFVVAYLLLFPSGQRIDTSTYQVVYLNNNQFYFGKLQNTSGDYLVIKSPYTAQDIQGSSKEDSKDSEPKTTLLKVRDQVYGPDNSIAIRSEQVLFWQNLRSDSKVVQAIEAKN